MREPIMPTIPFSEPPSVDESGRIQRIGRRAFILSAAGAVSAVAFWSLRRGTVAAASPLAKDDGPKMVTIIQFGADGKKIGKAAVPRLVKPDAEWQHQLSPAAYWVTRHADTERPFTGESLNEHRHGIFRCIGCDLALFSSETKFDSGTGWPAYSFILAAGGMVSIVKRAASREDAPATDIKRAAALANMVRGDVRHDAEPDIQPVAEVDTPASPRGLVVPFPVDIAGNSQADKPEPVEVDKPRPAVRTLKRTPTAADKVTAVLRRDQIGRASCRERV